MSFTPHTIDDLQTMLDTIGIASLDDLFSEVPTHLRRTEDYNLPERLTELATRQLMEKRAAAIDRPLCFIGAGAYEHHVPAMVWDVATRGEFLTSYTPYQAEASQGTLQTLYEYQTMLARLTGMEVANASMYDGATALAEAVLMARRLQRKKPARVAYVGALNPRYREVVTTFTQQHGIEWVALPYDPQEGKTALATLEEQTAEDFAAIVIQHPNFFGQLEEIDAITNWAHAGNALVIASVNPIALGLLRAPGQWGEKGADIVCGEGQPLGLPLASGGPYCGFFCTRKAMVRQMPGRIVGRTVDSDNTPCFTLTLQAREQHIRRAKATSNICTNQGLAATVNTIYMALMGPKGLENTASQCFSNTRLFCEEVANAPHLATRFSGAHFHEQVIQVKNANISELIEALQTQGILAGYPLGNDFPELDDCLLVCVTETKSRENIQAFVQQLENTAASSKN